MAAWKVVDSFLVLQTPNGSACLCPWANPSYYHGVITFADGRIEYVKPTDHFASQEHMADLPRMPEVNDDGYRFGHASEAAKWFCEMRLTPPKKGRTAWARVIR